MKSVQLSGSLRANVGKVNAKAVREKGNVPCVIYGGKEQIHFEADIRAFKPVIFTPTIMKVLNEGDYSLEVETMSESPNAICIN